MASICDYTNEDGIVDSDGLGDAAADFRAGEISDDLLGDVSAAYRDGEPVKKCLVDNVSSLSVGTPSLTEVSSATVEATATVTNNITSGSGERLSGTLPVTVDGDRVEGVSYDLAPGDSTTVSATIDGLSGGTYFICID